jgi:hypothetical protein
MVTTGSTIGGKVNMISQYSVENQFIRTAKLFHAKNQLNSRNWCQD